VAESRNIQERFRFDFPRGETLDYVKKKYRCEDKDWVQAWDDQATGQG
jgi:hypothetical protein